MRDDFDDDLIGDAGPVENIGEYLSLRADSEVYGIQGGVSVAWMMKAFRLGRQTIEKRIRGCHPIGTGKHSSPLYDLPEVSSYLVIPRHKIAEYLEDVKPEDLPEKLREGYWNAKLKEQRWEEKAQDLWRTTRVLETISDVLTDIRSKLQLIPSEVERTKGLNSEQRRVIGEIVEGVQEEIYQYILNLSKSSFTPNQSGEGVEGSRAIDEDDLI